ncbi:mandelate racemase/muconate lactonizing enzyme family protein (plasmid) [Agrobacterium leguminum]|uniref:Mandelate racemase/muconate lactonizing enzyme, C-terminal domain protein n=1 Tax=Agrobacterium deltaense NCPPB 1641 TaxID=1183425 RepID=A0A1S7UAQ3_9HYPH|nr:MULTISPECIES: mandelate racemase/muconate lactonizing enzyme family protein [Agrobacterium]WFS70075.1 mandelate racemase/muconate lactonizing enzyme family protein [Agrobacterium leguminum]CVI63438.1 Mandelate racemase/muconate lactonizing enzyme, C-terminal domain protein [Agrobacterium deltaense NCPPB 1641]
MKIKKIDVFQLSMGDASGWMPKSAFVRIETEDGTFGLGEASPMQGGYLSLVVIGRDMAPFLIDKDVFDHSVLLDLLMHKCIKLGPEGIVTGALAAIDIALWDLRGKLLGKPIYKLLGGAWSTSLPCYSSIGGNAKRSVEETVRAVAARVENENPAAVKIRWDGDRTRQDVDIKGDIEKAKAVRKLLGDDFQIGFDANNGYSVGGAMRVGRALEDLGYSWFEEPVQHYNIQAMGEVAQRLDITVSAGEQTYTLQGLKDLIEAGVRMVQPDIIKMGGITGMMQCAALARAHGVELVPHQTQPVVGHLANIHVMSTIMHRAKPVELADQWERGAPVFTNPSQPTNGKFEVPDRPGLGIEFDQEEMNTRRIEVAVEPTIREPNEYNTIA